MTQLLILEDDMDINNALKIFFEKNGYSVHQAYRCTEATDLLRQITPDILIIDISLPDGSGLQIGKEIVNQYNLPVVFLTARDEESDIINGYEVGCEEYITKPISPVVLEKKIKTILKRRSNENDIMYYKELKIDFDKQRLWKTNEEISLTAKEWKIFHLLAKNKGKIITQEVLLEKIWDVDGNFVDKHAVTVVINRLRKKVETDSAKPEYIKNIFGVGYTFGD